MKAHQTIPVNPNIFAKVIPTIIVSINGINTNKHIKTNNPIIPRPMKNSNKFNHLIFNSWKN